MDAHDRGAYVPGMPGFPDPASELEVRCDEVLHYIWDPIGIRGQPGARDEYCSYGSEVTALLVTGANREQVRDHLNNVSLKMMGLTGGADSASEALVRWRDSLGRSGKKK